MGRINDPLTFLLDLSQRLLSSDLSMAEVPLLTLTMQSLLELVPQRNTGRESLMPFTKNIED